MSGLDYEKEVIGYHKLWLGVLLVSGISLFGWLVNNYASAPNWLIIGSIVLLYVLIGFISFIGFRIESIINKLKRY